MLQTKLSNCLTLHANGCHLLLKASIMFALLLQAPADQEGKKDREETGLKDWSYPLQRLELVCRNAVSWAAIYQTVKRNTR